MRVPATLAVGSDVTRVAVELLDEAHTLLVISFVSENQQSPVLLVLVELLRAPLSSGPRILASFFLDCMGSSSRFSWYVSSALPRSLSLFLSSAYAAMVFGCSGVKLKFPLTGSLNAECEHKPKEPNEPLNSL